MVWSNELGRMGKNRTHYIREIRQLVALLVLSDGDFRRLISSSNCSFEEVVRGIRPIVERARRKTGRPRMGQDLLSNTNWSHHDETYSDPRYADTIVNEAHCDCMVALFEAFVREYIQWLNARNSAIMELKRVRAEAGDVVAAYDVAISAANLAGVASDHDAVQQCQQARDAAVASVAQTFVNFVQEMPLEYSLENGWFADARILRYYEETGHTDKEAFKNSRFYAIQSGLAQRGRRNGTIEPVRTGISNFIRLTGGEDI